MTVPRTDPDLDKNALLIAVRARIDAEIAEATRLAKDAAEGATHEENKPEGDKDMRSTEASYIARGQAERVRTLEGALKVLGAMPVKRFADGDAIQVSAIVELADGATTDRYFLVSAGGGMRVRASEDGPEVQTLAVQSPIGKALLGLSAGDETEIATPRGVRRYEVVSVR
jgi:transcription elongation GreA/GreB family factor